MERPTYNTSARRAILDYMRENRDRQFSSSELASHFDYPGAPGKSTVYRQLSELCSEGIIRRYADSGKKPLYQYFSEGGCGGHFHMKCTGCGKLFHLECDEMKALAEHISREHGFSLDCGAVLMGLCGSCNKESSEQTALPERKEKDKI